MNIVVANVCVPTPQGLNHEAFVVHISNNILIKMDRNKMLFQDSKEINKRDFCWQPPKK